MILILTFVSHSFYSQSSLDSFPYTIDSNILDLRVDRLQNVWQIYPNYILRKSQDKAYQDTFNYRFNPDNNAIDLKFTLKNLFFNKQSNSIELLNSRWGVLSTLKLDKIEIYQPCLVKFSSDENFWVLDMSSNNLFKVNENGIKKYIRKNPFKIGNKFFFPTNLIDNKSYIVALDTSYGLFVIDDYGNLSQHIWLASANAIFPYGENIILVNDSSMGMYAYDTKDRQLKLMGKNISITSKIKSIVELNENALILNENKRIYKIENLSKLFLK
mgnify:CR=1 FL=1